MTAPLPARPLPPVDPVHLLRQAAEGLEARLGTAPAGSLVSAGLSLPAAALPDPLDLDGDTLWSAGNERMAARGQALAVHADSPDALARRFSALRESWIACGCGAPPRAMFAFPFGGEGARLWVPLAQIHRHGEEATLTLSAAAGAPVQSCLAEAERMLLGRAAAAAPWEPATVTRTSELPSSAAWRDRVAAAIQAIAAGRFDKVVLSRCLDLALSRPIDPARVVHALAARYPECNVFALPVGSGTIVAASPERLAVKTGAGVVSHCLAGTIARGAGAAEDEAQAESLRASVKERHEHQLVVTAVARGLAELCTGIAPPSQPAVMRLRRVQHLWTPIAGRARPGTHLLDVVARLHPTPAVAGWPLREALDWLELAGETRGGCYTGAAGWIDPCGDGEAAVVLRSALLEGCSARLWAGAGIVAGSEPAAELAETTIKLSTLLDVLGLG